MVSIYKDENFNFIINQLYSYLLVVNLDTPVKYSPVGVQV